MTPHIQQVFAGEYDIPLEVSRPTILDIGANVGAFTVWCSNRWPGCTVHAYEPIKENYALFLQNLVCLRPDCHVEPHRAAVLGHDLSRRRMRHGLNNPGEASFYNLGEQSKHLEKVPVMSAHDLPESEIVKIDTEGCEVEILEGLPMEHVRAIMLEYHREEDRLHIRDLLTNFELISTDTIRVDRGIMKFLRQSEVKT